MDAPIVDEDIVHLDVGGLAVLLVLKLDKRKLQRVARLAVANHLRAANGAEARKNDLQVLIARHGVELADEKDVFRRENVFERKVADLKGS